MNGPNQPGATSIKISGQKKSSTIARPFGQTCGGWGSGFKARSYDVIIVSPNNVHLKLEI